MRLLKIFEHKDQVDESERKKFSSIGDVLEVVVVVWAIYVIYKQPETIQQWVNVYGINEYITFFGVKKFFGIKDTDVAIIFFFGVLVAYIILRKIISVLFSLASFLRKTTENDYSTKHMERFRSVKNKK